MQFCHSFLFSAYNTDTFHTKPLSTSEVLLISIFYQLQFCVYGDIFVTVFPLLQQNDLHVCNLQVPPPSLSEVCYSRAFHCSLICSLSAVQHVFAHLLSVCKFGICFVLFIYFA